MIPGIIPVSPMGRFITRWAGASSPNGEIFFDNVRSPKSLSCGELNRGFEINSRSNKGDIENPTCYLGICKAIIRSAGATRDNGYRGENRLSSTPR